MKKSPPYDISDYVPPALTGEELVCPCCRASWKDKKIPSKDRKFYGTRTHFSKLIGIEIQGQYDGVSAWQCPECRTQFPRKYVSQAGQFRTNDVVSA